MKLLKLNLDTSMHEEFHDLGKRFTIETSQGRISFYDNGENIQMSMDDMAIVPQFANQILLKKNK